MKFHETHYEDYIEKVKEYNIHNELLPFYKNLPSNIDQFRNLILFGPTGTGKYSQALKIIEKYSPSNLKYEKMALQTEVLVQSLILKYVRARDDLEINHV